MDFLDSLVCVFMCVCVSAFAVGVSSTHRYPPVNRHLPLSSPRSIGIRVLRTNVWASIKHGKFAFHTIINAREFFLLPFAVGFFVAVVDLFADEKCKNE